MNQPINEPTFQLSPQMSTIAPEIDQIYYWIYWLSVAFFVAIVGAMCWWSWKYRRRPGHKAVPTGHNLVLEVTWTVLPVFVIMWLFHIGFKGYINLSIAPADSMEIRVRGFQWGWDFEYPTGDTDKELHVPAGRNVKLIMSSNDVLHAFWAPELRVKRDLVPGMYTTLWFNATHTGVIDMYCAEYCGGRSSQNGEPLEFEKFAGHWKMLSKVHIQTQADFDKYLESISLPPGEQLGASLYAKKQCNTCHTIDGSKAVAPTWKGLFGKHESLVDGTSVVVDENYIRESILQPNAKVVSGYAAPSVMPTYQGTLKEKDLDSLIAYIKTLK